jgi:pseudouridine synthase
MKNSSRILPDNLVRLEKHIAQLGLASRREAKDLILKGLVQVNGDVVINPGHGFNTAIDTVTVQVDLDNPKEYILLYKPRGIETNKTGTVLRDIHDMYPEYTHLSPIGRLDAESEGLIILSNDGVLAKKLTQQETHIGKTYHVTVREVVTEDMCATMANGILLDGVLTKKAEVHKLSDHTFSIVLYEGRKHQIRRMADAVHLTVERLVRVAIGSIKADSMASGDVRVLTEDEIQLLA